VTRLILLFAVDAYPLSSPYNVSQYPRRNSAALKALSGMYVPS
jgi:hypothetical protein